MTIYSVLLVEDEIGIRQSIAKKILAHPNLSLYGSVGSCAEAVALINGKPDVLLTDLGLPDGSGISLVQQARAATAPIETMILTIFGDEMNVISSIEAGASSYLLKEHGLDNIADAICAMMAGESMIDPLIARFLLSRLNQKQSSTTTSKSPLSSSHKGVRKKLPHQASKPAQENALSGREIEVLQMVSKGLTYAEAGGVLDISVNTIRAHIRNIYTKLAVNSRFEAIYEATVLGIIEPISKITD
ncbi:MAG: response regulator transcription factor [Mariprofundus sp.]|nr:response regulator transcription factor [Mariprofundus sp.]